MEIIIPLPHASSTNTYEELKGYLKQLELAVHYAQKSIENSETIGIKITEDCIISFEHPSLDQETIDKLYEELQSISLKIVLQ